ncbi:MAG: hypothetical protein MAG795_00815 [Candidatus Woesearchaeota archaeon]|nr:hypothetical protein [Candidatus Woesearchaeota archaeon]
MSDISKILKELTNKKPVITEEFREFDRRLVAGLLVVYENPDLTIAEYHGAQCQTNFCPILTQRVKQIENDFKVKLVETSEGYLPETRNRPYRQTQVFAKIIKSEQDFTDVYQAGQSLKYC